MKTTVKFSSPPSQVSFLRQQLQFIDRQIRTMCPGGCFLMISPSIFARRVSLSIHPNHAAAGNFLFRGTPRSFHVRTLGSVFYVDPFSSNSLFKQSLPQYLCCECIRRGYVLAQKNLSWLFRMVHFNHCLLEN